MKSNVPFNDFSNGELSKSIKGKINLSIYRNGVEIMQNYYTNAMGNAIYRHGFLFISDTKNNEPVWFREFRFNIEQSYLIVLSDGVFRFLSYDGSGNLGYVLSGGLPLEVAHPYSLADLKDLKTAQDGDVMYFVHPDYAPRKLTRISAASFTFSTFIRTNDPFSAGNWPRSVAFYESRLYYGGSTQEPTTLFGSKAGSPDDFTTTSDDDSAIEFVIRELSDPIEWLFSGANALIVGSAEGLVATSGGSTNTAITPSTIYAKKVLDEGCSNITPIRKDGQIIYIQNNNRKARSFSYEILAESYQSRDLNLINYDTTQNGMKELIYKKDRYDLIYSVREDGQLIGFSYNIFEERNGWFRFITNGEIISIGGLTNPQGDTELFACIKRNINGSDVYYIEEYSGYTDFSKKEDFYGSSSSEEGDNANFKRVVFEQMKEYNYLDCSIKNIDLKTETITFDGVDTITTSNPTFSAGDVGKRIKYKSITGAEFGEFEIKSFVSATEVEVEKLTPTISSNTNSNWYLTFNIISGLDHLEGEEVYVLADGGFLGIFTVSSNQIDLEEQVSVAYVGFNYSGILKLFNLGFLMGATSTQQTKKNVYKASIRFNYSAGGKFGTSLYELRDIQEFNPLGNFDEPPLLMIGDVEIKYKDNFRKEKTAYLVQDKPLPLNAVMFTLFTSTNPYT